MTASFTIKGLDRVVKACAKGFPKSFELFEDDVSDELVTQHRAEAPKGKTKRLSDSGYVKRTGSGRTRRLVLTNDVEYADFVNRGTRPHLITPVHKQALYWPGAVHPVHSVRHPGTHANPFLDRAVNAAQPAINGRHADAFRENAAREFEE